MESVAIVLAAAAVIATALFKAAAAWAQLCPEKTELDKFDYQLVAAQYPEQPGAPIVDGLPGTAAVVPWENTAGTAIEDATAAAARTMGAFLKISDDLQTIIPDAATALRDNSRAVGIASVAAAATPILFPGRDADEVYTEWYWQIATVYHEPTVVAAMAPPDRIALELDAPLRRVVYAATHPL
jgi:hypothetical protein